MKHLVRDVFRKEGYVFATRAFEIARNAGCTQIARLASNENPYPPSPAAVKRAMEALASVNRYPDESSESLIRALRTFHGDYSFVTGVGMDGIIETVIRTLINPGDGVGVSIPTFSFYGLATEAQGGIVQTIPRTGDFSIQPDQFISECRNLKLSFICSPNNPTGNAILPNIIEEILDGINGMLFLDNAYVEFSRHDYRPLMKRHDNLILGRTFSKAFSLAGLRIGYAFVPEWFIPFYRRAETPFTLNSVSAAAAEGALSDNEHLSMIIGQVSRWRSRFCDEIKFPVYPSDANFVLIDVTPFSGEQAVEKLAERGVIVRSCTSFPGLGNRYIRVSIGDTLECEQFLQEINSL